MEEVIVRGRATIFKYVSDALEAQRNGRIPNTGYILINANVSVELLLDDETVHKTVIPNQCVYFEPDCDEEVGIDGDITKYL